MADQQQQAVTPPAGYVLDPPAGVTPPPGYVLDAPTIKISPKASYATTGELPTAASRQNPGQKVADFATDTLSNIPSSAVQFGKNLYGAVAHPLDTAEALGKVAVGTGQKMTAATGLKADQSYAPNADAAWDALKERYGSVDALAHTVRTDPVGFASDLATVAGGVSGAAGLAGDAAKAAGLARTASAAGKVADVAGTVSDAANPLKLAGKVASNIPIPEKFTPEGMYLGALKVPPARLDPAERSAVAATGIREAIPVSRGGYETAGQRIGDLNGQIDSTVANASAAQGPVIQPNDVADRLKSLRTKFENQVNPDEDVGAIDRSGAQFLNKHTSPAAPGAPPNPPSPMTIAEAQAEKRGTYRQLHDKAYGELGSANIEAQKALARGLKEEIVSRVPELAALNARDSSLIQLEEQLSRFVAREGNKNAIGLIPAVMGGALIHGPEGGAIGGMAGLAALAIDNPNIRSRIAIALDRAKKLKPVVSGKGDVVNNLVTADRAASSQSQFPSGPPRFAKGGIVHHKPGGTRAIIGEGGQDEAVVPRSKAPAFAKAVMAGKSLPDPAKLTAARSTVPEKPETVAAQLQQLRGGARRAVMIPRGTFPHPTPPRMLNYVDSSQNRYVYDPKAIKETDIRNAIARNMLPTILGASDGGMGAPDKSLMGPDAVNVVGRTADGTTLQSTAADRRHVPRAMRQTQKVTPRGGKVSVENPAREIARRLK